jgi:uncharacterized protein (TIGR02596 family)
MAKKKSYAKRGHGRRGFTLVEILVVMVIVAGLLALVTPPLMGVIDANRLTQSGQSLLFRLSMAKQMALTQNRPVEIRFFHYADDNGAVGYHAAQMYFYDEEGGGLEEIETPIYFASGIMIPDSPVSPLLGSGSQAAGGNEMPEAEREPFKSLQAKYRSLIFYPNGSTNISLPLRDAYVTLCSTRADVSQAAEAPPNYYTIQVDPINGSSKIYRPE